tara:strand:+ start:4694 stop:4879 length:186 start_codon:yes stop_codon:yes gene_type:complete
MIKIEEQQLKELIEDLIMIEDDIYTCLDEEPTKNDRLNGSGYMIGRVIRVLKSKLEKNKKV